MKTKNRKIMVHSRLCPECSNEMKWYGFYYYCADCNITQFPYSTKATIGVAIIALITIATIMI